MQELVGNRAVQLLVADRSAPIQRFDTSEHLRSGDAGADSLHSQQVPLAAGYFVTYGEMIAMAGDYFGSLEQLRELAIREGPGAGTREEIEYVRVAKIRRQSGQFSEEARRSVDRRYYDLARGNRSHFVNPETGDEKRSTQDKAEGTSTELRLQWTGLLPRFLTEMVIPQAGAGYRHYHLQAIFEAYVEGFQGRSMDAALAPEAFGAHYLTDAFSGGHLRTNRVSISEHWNPKLPMFNANLKGFIAQALALRIGDAETWVSREMAYSGLLWKEGTLSQVSAMVDETGGLTFGDVVSGAIHDYDSGRGVSAMVEGRPTQLAGDERLSGSTEDLVSQAVNLSHNDVTRAWFVGQRRGSLEEVLSTTATGGLVGAERMLPVVIPDSQLPESQRSVRWDFATVDDLLASAPFQLALAEFGRRKAADLQQKESSLPPIAKPHFRPAVVEPFANSIVETVRRIVNWTPDTGGGFLGHNQDDNALDYYEQARAVGAVGSLTAEQRIRLIRHLLDGYTAEDEENAVFDLLTANAADSATVIAAVGWDRLEDELGKRFTRRFPESANR
jgi:hypothetical protein